MKRIVILQEVVVEGGIPLLQVVADFESLKDTDLWLKNEAPDGVFHRHSVLRHPLTVQAESVQVRTLTGGGTVLQRTHKEKANPKPKKDKK